MLNDNKQNSAQVLMKHIMITSGYITFPPQPPTTPTTPKENHCNVVKD